MTFFESHKKPNSKKNFFQNYSDHLDHLETEFQKAFNDFTKKKTLCKQLDFISGEAVKRISIFEKLRDGHDYFDEVVGATALPLMALGMSLAALGKSILEAGTALAINLNLIEDDRNDHLENAGTWLMASAASFVLAIASFLKSVVSLITRPVVTAIQGFAEQDKNRFDVKDSVVGSITSSF